eukprot:ctg_2332.g440
MGHVSLGRWRPVLLALSGSLSRRAQRTPRLRPRNRTLAAVAAGDPPLLPAAAASSISPAPPSLTDTRYIPLSAQPLFHRQPRDREEALELIPRYARRSATPVSLRQLVDFGRKPTAERLLLAAQLMHRELSIRLAHRVVELQSLPYGLSDMRSVQRVRELYENSFADLIMYPRPERKGEEERRFTELLRRIRDRHADVVRQMARGVLELKQACGLGADNLHISSFLDRFYTSRIGIRVLISQQNSLRATYECHRDSPDALPPVKLIIADGQEDVTLKIADEGGGIPRSSLPEIWTYMFTTAPAPPESLIQDDVIPPGGATPASRDTDPIAGLGYGLPLSRLYARYFGGELSITSMEGYGTDAYIHLAKLGNKLEALV